MGPKEPHSNEKNVATRKKDGSRRHINPYSPGAGHSPPYLAGRQKEVDAFLNYLRQGQVLTNVVLTGLRGTGKTVLMEDRYKPCAQEEGWVWVGSDFSESCFLSEGNLCVRLLTDLAVFASCLQVSIPDRTLGFDSSPKSKSLSFDFLVGHFQAQPGLTVNKLKSTIELVWNAAQASGTKGILFAYDEAQVVQDRSDKEEYPLAVVLETFQSLQRKGVRCMLLLTGLPTLFSRLVESRTYAERMFTVQELGRLSPDASRQAIEKPLQKTRWTFTAAAIEEIITNVRRLSLLYPVHLPRNAGPCHRASDGPDDADGSDHQEARFRFFCRSLGKCHGPPARAALLHCATSTWRPGIYDCRSGRFVKNFEDQALRPCRRKPDLAATDRQRSGLQESPGQVLFCRSAVRRFHQTSP